MQATWADKTPTHQAQYADRHKTSYKSRNLPDSHNQICVHLVQELSLLMKLPKRNRSFTYLRYKLRSSIRIVKMLTLANQSCIAATMAQCCVADMSAYVMSGCHSANRHGAVSRTLYTDYRPRWYLREAWLSQTAILLVQEKIIPLW